MLPDLYRRQQELRSEIRVVGPHGGAFVFGDKPPRWNFDEDELRRRAHLEDELRTVDAQIRHALFGY